MTRPAPIERDADLLLEFEAIVRRYHGRTMAPASDLPLPPADMRRRFESMRAATPSLDLDAAIVELESFVPDDEAAADLAFSTYYAEHPRERWRDIRARWGKVAARQERIREARNSAARRLLQSDDTTRALVGTRADAYRLVGSTIGSARESLRLMQAEAAGNLQLSDAGWGYLAFVMVPLGAIAAGVAAGLGLSAVGKSLWWAIPAIVAIPLLVVSVLLRGEALERARPEWSQVIVGAVTFTMFLGWLVVAAFVVVLAP